MKVLSSLSSRPLSDYEIGFYLRFAFSKSIFSYVISSSNFGT